MDSVSAGDEDEADDQGSDEAESDDEDGDEEAHNPYDEEWDEKKAKQGCYVVCDDDKKKKVYKKFARIVITKEWRIWLRGTQECPLAT